MATETETNTQQLQRRNHELSILNAIAEALHREVDLTRALTTTLDKVVELFDLQTAWIWLINEQTGTPYLAAARHLPPALKDDPHAMDGERSCYCLDGYVYGDLAVARNVSIVTCTRLKGLVHGTGGLRAHTTVPLNSPDRRLGLLNVLGRDWSELTPDELRLLNTVGDLVSIAIERARLFEGRARLGALEERNRLAREIHDTLAQGLTAIALRLETADALLDSGAETDKVRGMVHDALHLVRHNLDEARRSVMDLRAAPLDGYTLAEAVEALARRMTGDHGLLLGFTAREQRPLPPRIEAGLYRIAQEALNNIIQHANARRVDLSLSTTLDEVYLVVEDDGRGFIMGEDTGDWHFGLTSLNERARLLGGKLTINSTPGQGTRIAVIVPLDGIEVTKGLEEIRND